MGKAAKFLLLLAGRFVGLLDQYSGAAAAYSLRSLSTSTTNVVKVRRDSDDSEQDFTASDITNGTLLSFVNADVEKIVNGDFATDTDWTKGTGWSISGGTANCDGTQTSNSEFKTTVGIAVQGVQVTFSFEVKNYSAGTLNATLEGTGTLDFSGINANGVYSTTATSSDPLPKVTFTASSDFIGSIDDVSVIQSTANGLVTTWYDQSGNGNNATQATAASQPKIVDSGTLVAENGKAAMSCDSDFLEIPSSTSTFNFLHNGTTSAVFGVVRYGNSANPNPDQYSLIGNGSWQTSIRGIDIGYSDAESASRFDASTVLIGGVSSYSALSIDSNKITPNEVCLHSVFLDSDNATASLRAQAGVNAGALFGTNTLTSTISSLDAQYNLCIGAYKFGSAFKVLKGALQEVIIYDSDQSANRTGIEANINAHYNIYS